MGEREETIKNDIMFNEILKNIKFNCLVVDRVLSETIAKENGEDVDIIKFNDIRSFAMYIKAMNDLTVEYIESKLSKNQCDKK